MILVEQNHLTDHLTAVAEAFSRKAEVYDSFGEDHPNLSRMRQKVRRHALTYLRPDDRILELNAGTGADAAFFASLGFTIHATDLSSGMLAKIEQKIISLDLGGRLTTQLCSFDTLDQLDGGPYDYIFSNMGGLNCTQNLERVANGVAKLLAPGGRITLVVMPPVCIWELASALRGKFSVAFRRLRPQGTLADVEGVQFMTWYHPPRRVMHAFGNRFFALHIQGLSVLTPPADHKFFPRNHPGLYHTLCRLDDLVADHHPFDRWGDFYILTLEKCTV